MELHAPVSPPRPSSSPSGRGPLLMVTMAFCLLAVGLLGLYLAPDVALRWRLLEEHSAAEGAYLRREAELKAESEAGQRNLAQLDKRFQLVSLGFREVARKAAPVVVNITNEITDEEELASADGRRRTFYDYESGRSYAERAEGSGVLIGRGLVLTNHHVVDRAGRLRITFASGRWVLVTPAGIASDPLTDLALVRLPEPPRPSYEPDYSTVAEFADSDKDVQVGDWVLAAGSPFGLKQTVTAGIVSAKGRVELGVLDQVDLIQTDAAINPGNSGGPLFDLHGRMIGINVAIASRTGEHQGVAFAIPSNTAKEVMDQLLERGEVVRGFLGVGLQELQPGMDRQLGVSETGGVIVTMVSARSPAYQAGIRKGDLILRYNQEPVGMVNPVTLLRQRIARTSPETTVSVEVLRQLERFTVDVTVTKRPAKL